MNFAYLLFVAVLSLVLSFSVTLTVTTLYIRFKRRDKKKYSYRTQK